VIYTATITTASLRLRESRIIANLLLQDLSEAAWKEALLERNVLQMSSIESIRRTSRLLRARLKSFDQEIWLMIRDGDSQQAAQATLACAIKNSRLLGDFMDLPLREQKTLYATKLEQHMWNDYLGSCRGRDPDMPHWSDTTIARLRSTVFSMLAEVGYLKDTKSLLLQNVFVDTQLATYLRDHNENYVLRCLEVFE
jgi:hypothetical protein